MTAGPRDGLALAMEEVRQHPPPPLTLERHPLSLAALGEAIEWAQDKRRQEGKAADSAA